MKFRVLTEEEAIAIAQVFKDLEDDTLDFALDEIKYLASCSRTMRKICLLYTSPSPRDRG